MRAHLTTNWHRHLALWATAAALAILLTGIGAGAAIALHFKGGFRPGGPMPPRIAISGGVTPPSASLASSIVRIHNQGSSSSCVGQTISQIAELVVSQRGRPAALSAGFIYDQVNGGVDAGTTWAAALGILTSEGDAPLAAFPHDGQDYLVQPGLAAIAAARPHRFRSWRSVDPTDTHTIEAELAAGRPLGLAIPVHDTFYAHTCTVPIAADTGSFYFWHAVTVIGYSPTGIRVLNSWGPTWGCGGQGTITWPQLDVYAAQGASMIVALPFQPRPPHTTPEPTTTPTPGSIPTSRSIPPPPATPTPILLLPTPSPGSCTIRGMFPDPLCTPGEVFSAATPAQICVTGYTTTVRNVPPAEKRQIFARYGISAHAPGQYEIDHFIPLELGGDNAARNLWPEPASPSPGFHQKDLVENALHALVCSGQLSLQRAQTTIRTNWLAYYRSGTLAAGGRHPITPLPPPRPINGSPAATG